MKNTGVIRRIDDLGRIVIPKEIRKNLRINDNESMEIYIYNDENIILKKHSLLKKIEDFAQKFIDSMNVFIKHNIIITDRNEVIAVSNNLKKGYLHKPISEKLQNSILRRENILEKYKKEIELIPNKIENATFSISSIVANSDVVGLVIIFSFDEEISTLEEKITNIASQFLGKYLEE